VFLRIKNLFLDYFGVSFERGWHLKVPIALTQLILYEGVVMTPIGTTSVDDNTLELVNTVLWEF
jgi:hypothetical protein